MTCEFLEKPFCSKNSGNGPKIGFLNLKKNLVSNLHWICPVMKIYVICCVPAQILHSGKNVPEIQANMLSANQNAGFLLFLQNKSMKQPHFLHVDTNSQKLKVDRKFFVDMVKKWMWSSWSLDSKIDYLKNDQIKVTDFLHAGTNPSRL